MCRGGVGSIGGAALRVQLGTALDGDEPVWLDLRDIAYGGHGCHGLLVGSGSGAAQLWQSMMMSLARSCSPAALRMWLVYPGLESPDHAERTVEALLAELSLPSAQQELMRKGAAQQRRWGEEVLLLSAPPHVEKVIGTPEGGACDAQRLRQCLHDELDRRSTVLREARCVKSGQPALTFADRRTNRLHDHRIAHENPFGVSDHQDFVVAGTRRATF